MARTKKPKRIVAYKCTRPDGTDFRTGTLNYAKALKEGTFVEVEKPDPALGQVCGRGVHVSPTVKQTCQFGDRGHRPWRWFRGYVEAPDLIERDSEKMRVRRFKPTKELTLADVFGADLAERVTKARVEIGTWAAIPWLKPAREVSEGTLKRLFLKWHKAILPWLGKGLTLPKDIQIVRTAKEAADAADAADAAADAADAAAADAAAAAAADAAAADAADAADAAADRLYRRWSYWPRWYVRPYSVLLRSARWGIAGMDKPSPWEPLVAMYRLGVLPIGYSGGQFVIYVPEPKS